MRIKHKLLLFFSILSLSFPQFITAQSNPNAIVEDVVRFYFADIPVMIDIAKCESGFRQYASEGSALYDPTGTYIGIFQISEDIHTPRARSMGFDLSNIDGNMGYARYLYNISGTGPWKGCVHETAKPVVLTGLISSNLSVGMSSPQVLQLQQILNANGFMVATSGPGSPGSETNYFGALTRAAVRKFQCAKGIVCSGSEGTTGFGRVGPQTRAAINSL